MWKTTNEPSILEKIEYAKNLFFTQRDVVTKEKYIEKLLFEDYVSQVQRNTSRYDFMANIVDEAVKEVDKKLKKERKHLDMLTSWVSEDFCGNRKIKIMDMLHGGWENYYWCIGFVLEGKTFYIHIPQVKNLTADNFAHAHYGKFSLAIKENEVLWNTLIQSYQIEDIAKFMDEYLKEDK